MHNTPQALADISAKTLAFYDRFAADFWRGTRDHDVAQNIDALLRHLGGAGPFRILDFGCGPGRDLCGFRDLGHEVVGLDGSAAFAVMAREHSGCEVWVQDFLALDLPDGHFDGVFANASLFHVPGAALPSVLRALHGALRPGGVLFSSNPRGDDAEGWNGERYGVFYRDETWRGRCEAAGFALLEHYWRPAGLPVAQRPWLASVWRRVEQAGDRAGETGG